MLLNFDSARARKSSCRTGLDRLKVRKPALSGHRVRVRR